MYSDEQITLLLVYKREMVREQFYEERCFLLVFVTCSIHKHLINTEK